MAKDIERKPIFFLGSDGRGVPTVIVGIPAGAWEHMKDGKTTHFDLSRVGLPIQFVLFGAENHDAVMALINQHNASQGTAYVDMRRENFGIEPLNAAMAKAAGETDT